MSCPYEKVMRSAASAHYNDVTRAIDRFDTILLEEYSDMLDSKRDEPAVLHAVMDPVYDRRLDKSTGALTPYKLYGIGDSELVWDNSGPQDIDYGAIPEKLVVGYEAMRFAATSEENAIDYLKYAIGSAYSSQDIKKIAVRKKLHVFRLDTDTTASHQSSRVRFAADTIALPEVVNADITRKLAEGALRALHRIDQLADNPRVEGALRIFKDLDYRLARQIDHRDKKWAPLRMYKEGVVTAAQTVSFLSEGIDSEDKFFEHVELWKTERTFEKISATMRQAIVGPLAVRAIQPLSQYIRTPEGGLQPAFVSALTRWKGEMKQLIIDAGVYELKTERRSEKDIHDASPSQIIRWANFYDMGHSGCLASQRVIRNVASLALAGIDATMSL